MSLSAESSSASAGPGAGSDLTRCLAAIDPRDLPPEVVQQLMTVAVRAYSHLAECGVEIPPLLHDSDVTATDAVRAASGILKALDLETFELALWQMFGGGAR